MVSQIWKALLVLAAVCSVFGQLPALVDDLQTITLQDGTSFRYKEPGICETTEGVKSYSGFIDIAEDKHIFFWFFQSRRDPASDPITLWLNGGPGADAMGGLFEGILTLPSVVCTV